MAFAGEAERLGLEAEEEFAVENGLPINEYSVYKTVMQEVKWI